MRMYIVFAIFLILPLAQGTFQPSREGDIWQEAGLDSGYARRFVRNSLCRKDEKFAKACTGAIRRGLQFLADRGMVTDALAAEWKNRPAQPDFERFIELLDAAAPANKSMMYGVMVNEYLATFDAHAKVMPVAALNQMFGSQAGEEVTPGFEVEATGEGLYIRRVYPDSPAELAGLQAHDRIVYLNGEAVGAGLAAFQAARKLRGEAGKEIQLTVLHGDDLIPVSLPLTLRPSAVVVSELLTEQNRKYAVMRVPVFREGVCERAETELKILMEMKPDGLIIDLRANAGGRNDEARCFYRLLESKPLQIERLHFTRSLLPPELELRTKKLSPDGNRAEDHLARPSLFNKIPVAVLIGAKSASVTELLAAGLQDSQRAWLVGERTFGKGTFQLTEVLHFHTGLRLIHSVYQILRANSAPIQINGVTPNFEVPARLGAGALERRLVRELEAFPAAVQPAGGKRWREPRVRRRDRIRTCASGWARRTAGDDYQQAFAMAVLRCDSEN